MNSGFASLDCSDEWQKYETEEMIIPPHTQRKNVYKSRDLSDDDVAPRHHSMNKRPYIIAIPMMTASISYMNLRRSRRRWSSGIKSASAM